MAIPELTVSTLLSPGSTACGQGVGIPIFKSVRKGYSQSAYYPQLNNP